MRQRLMYVQLCLIQALIFVFIIFVLCPLFKVYALKCLSKLAPYQTKIKYDKIHKLPAECLRRAVSIGLLKFGAHTHF